MSIRFRIWPFTAAALLLAALGTGLYFYLRPRYKTAAEMVSLLPKSDAIVLYADVGRLRAGGILGGLEGAKGTEEQDYQRFVADTGFSYERDLDAIAVASVPDQVFAVLRGRFDWQRLRAYAKRQNGNCSGDYCRLPASTPGRSISFLPVRSDVMAFAISPDANAAYNLLPRRGAPLSQVPSYVVWAQIPKRILDKPDSLPPAVQIFARALSSTSAVTLGVDGSPANEFTLKLLAQCESDKQADLVRQHLAQLTEMLRSMLARGNRPPDEIPIGNVLTSGTFRSEKHQIAGEWRIPVALVDSLLH